MEKEGGLLTGKIFMQILSPVFRECLGEEKIRSKVTPLGEKQSWLPGNRPQNKPGLLSKQLLQYAFVMSLELKNEQA